MPTKASLSQRDERRKQALIHRRPRPGRPRGHVPLQSHPKRFEAALWNAFASMPGVGSYNAGRYVHLMLYCHPSYKMTDVGMGYAKLSAFYAYNYDKVDDHVRDINANARELLARATKSESDCLWLLDSVKSLFILLAGKPSHPLYAAAVFHLQLLGWTHVLEQIANRLFQLPTSGKSASTHEQARFARKYRSRNHSFGRKSSV